MNSGESKKVKVFDGRLFYRLSQIAKCYKKNYPTIKDIISDIDNFSDNYYSLFIWLCPRLKQIVEMPYFESKQKYKYPSLSHKEEVEEIVHEAFVRTLMEFRKRIKIHDIETVAHLQNRIARAIRHLAQNEMNKVLERYKKIAPLEFAKLVKASQKDTVNYNTASSNNVPGKEKKKERKVRQIQLPVSEEFDENKIILDVMIDEYVKQCSKMEELIFLNMVKKADYSYDKHQGTLLTERKIAEINGVCYTTVRNKKQKVKREFKEFWTGKKSSQQAG